MDSYRIYIVILLCIATIFPFACKKDKGKTISISFDISGRILRDCDSTPVYNYPLRIIVPYTIYEKSEKSFSKDVYATTVEFRTDVNGFYHIQSTLVIQNVISLTNKYNLVNDEIFRGIQVFSKGAGVFSFTSGSLPDSYLKIQQRVVFDNCANLLIDSNTLGVSFDSIAPIYLHKSNIRDSSLSNRIQIFSNDGRIISKDSLLSYSPIDSKTWYTYETKKKVGSTILFIKDSFNTGCKSKISINL